MPAGFPGYEPLPSQSEPGPARGIIAITPADGTDLPNGACRGLHANVAGAVKVSDMYGNTPTLTVTAGVPIPYAVKRVWATGTTATGLFALY
jgi:hypothetical protein